MTLLLDIPQPRIKRNYRPVTCWETRQRFSSFRRAAKWVGAHQNAIRAAVRSGGTAAAFHFYDPYVPESERPKLISKRWWVQCRETGEVFLSVLEAVDWLLNNRHVNHCILHTRKLVIDSCEINTAVGGFHFTSIPIAKRRDPSILGNVKGLSYETQ